MAADPAMRRTSSIGLVLARPPGYSETFLSAKIRGLREAGFDVRLFVGVGQRSRWVYPRLRIDRAHPVRAVFLTLWAWTALVTLRPVRVLRFFASERSLGRKWVRSVQLLSAYYPVLMHARPGWLHFEFAALAVEAESLAGAVRSRMGVSLRGYDIVIYPIKHPGCYTAVWSRVSKVHTISDSLHAAARHHGLPESVPVTKITPAVDPEFFHRTLPRPSGARVCRMLTVARLHWKKGLDYTLMALRLVSARMADTCWHYTIAGEGAELERLAFAASEMGLLERVTFAGKVEPAGLRRLYEETDVYVQYSVQEGFCNAVLEAQAMEVPCIVSDAEGLAENVGPHGVVVPRRRPELLAAALERFAVTPPGERDAIGRLARQRVAAEFGIQQQCRAFASFFD